MVPEVVVNVPPVQVALACSRMQTIKAISIVILMSKGFDDLRGRVQGWFLPILNLEHLIEFSKNKIFRKSCRYIRILYIFTTTILTIMATNDLLKGMLKPIILKLLLEKDRLYGYQMTQLVSEITEGQFELTFGALYPILHKLEQEGLVTTEAEVYKNRNRIYYSIAPKGRNKAKEKVNELENVVKTLKIFFKPSFRLEYDFIG